MLAAAGNALSPPETMPCPIVTVTSPHVLTCGDIRASCALGWSGIRANKREGDGATPAGRFPLRRVLFRPDRLPSIETRLPSVPISKRDGWCTNPGDPAYNQQIRLPRAGAHEDLWRDDELYDVIVVMGYNDSPVVPGKGSAIFLHIARPGMSRTDGCVAVALDVLLKLVRRCDVNTVVEIQP